MACREGPVCMAMRAQDEEGEGDAASLRGHTSPKADGVWCLPFRSASGGRPQVQMTAGTEYMVPRLR